MKIRALVDDDSPFLGFRKGDVFEAELDLSKESYIFIDKDGDRRVRFVGDFEVVNEEAEEEELENIIKELEDLNARAWAFGIYEDICVHESEMKALDKAIEILKGMK